MSSSQYDFQRGFIKADIVSYDQLTDAGSMADARAKGLGVPPQRVS